MFSQRAPWVDFPAYETHSRLGRRRLGPEDQAEEDGPRSPSMKVRAGAGTGTRSPLNHLDHPC